MSRVEYWNSIRPDPHYIPGLGRGAQGFTTRSDIGPSKFTPTVQSNSTNAVRRRPACSLAVPPCHRARLHMLVRTGVLLDLAHADGARLRNATYNVKPANSSCCAMPTDLV